jgi:hypothetical protein
MKDGIVFALQVCYLELYAVVYGIDETFILWLASSLRMENCEVCHQREFSIALYNIK